MGNYRHIQKLLTEVPEDGRFIFSDFDFKHRRYYVVVKHYNGYRMIPTKIEYPIEDKDGKLTGEIGYEYVMRKDPDTIIPRCRVKYIARHDKIQRGKSTYNEPVWVETVWDSEGVHVMYQEPFAETGITTELVGKVHVGKAEKSVEDVLKVTTSEEWEELAKAIYNDEKDKELVAES